MKRDTSQRKPQGKIERFAIKCILYQCIDSKTMDCLLSTQNSYCFSITSAYLSFFSMCAHQIRLENNLCLDYILHCTAWTENKKKIFSESLRCSDKTVHNIQCTFIITLSSLCFATFFFYSFVLFGWCHSIYYMPLIVCE